MQRKDLRILLLQIRDDANVRKEELESFAKYSDCLLYTSDAADDVLCVYLGGRRIIKKNF